MLLNYTERVTGVINIKIPLIPSLTKIFIFLLFNSVIPYTIETVAESKFAYDGIGVVLHSRIIIGKRVVIGKNVSIGRSLNSESIPEIGNNVYISAGARKIGKIKIEGNVIIGANAVVNKDVPSNLIVAGIPGKVIKMVDVDIYKL